MECTVLTLHDLCKGIGLVVPLLAILVPAHTLQKLRGLLFEKHLQKGISNKGAVFEGVLEGVGS